MSKYLTKEYRKDGIYEGPMITAESFAEAQQIADSLGVELLGKFLFELSGENMTDEKANEMLTALIEADQNFLN